MKADCPICKYIKENEVKALYEDSKVIAFLEEKPCTEGHIVIMPIEHYPILELVPDYVVNHMFQIANRLSKSIFETLNAQGTNILIHNGVAAGQELAHCKVYIIPRKSDDGLDFTWHTKQLEEEEMSTVELSLKEETKFIGSFEDEKAEPIKQEKESETIVESDEDNYLRKQIERIP